MNVLVSRAARRLVLRLDRGEYLHDALARIAQEHAVTAGAVTGTGVLEDVALTVYDVQRDRFADPRALEGAVELVALEGNLALSEGLPLATLHATLSRATDNGLQVLAGRVAAARVVHAELVLWCFDDVALERNGDPTQGLAAWGPGVVGGGAGSARPQTQAPRASEPVRREPVIENVRREPPPRVSEPVRSEPVRSEPKPASTPSGGGGGMKSLADVAKALEGMPNREDEIEDKLTRPEPEQGDVFDHPTYGIVEYVGDAPSGHARIRRSNGSIKEISLDVFDVVSVPPKGGKRAWALRTFKR